ncbi:unnamed protein product, partial [Prorocentrum cordatum]
MGGERELERQRCCCQRRSAFGSLYGRPRAATPLQPPPRAARPLAIPSARVWKVTPVEKVITLLEDLEAEVKEEGTKEAGTYDEYACFCKTTTETKSDSIMNGQDTIDTLSAGIAEDTATVAGKKTELQAKKKEIEERLSTEFDSIVASCLKEAAEFEAEMADLTKACNSLDKALQAVRASKGGGASLLQSNSTLRDEVGSTLAIAEAMSLVEARLVSGPSQGRRVDPDSPEYKFHSDGIITLLEKLKTEFDGKKSETQSEMEKATQICTDSKAELTGEIDGAKGEISSLETDIDTLKMKIAEDRGSLVEAEDMLKDDKVYLKDLTAQCETSAAEWDQRSQARGQELEVLAQALTIIRDGGEDGKKSVKDLETDAGLRSAGDGATTTETEDVAMAVREFKDNYGMGDPTGVDAEFEFETEIRLRLLRAMGGSPLKPAPVADRGATLALYGNHDANIAVSVNGRALRAARDRCPCEGGVASYPMPAELPNIVEEVFAVEQWQYVDHAEAHALLAFHASPLRTALVVVSDADFHIFYASLGGIRRLGRLDYSLGVMYMVLAGLLPEVTGKSNEKICKWPGTGNLFEDSWKTSEGDRDLSSLGWAGKLMGYAATGSPDEAIGSVVREAYEASGAMPKYAPEHIFSYGQGKTRLPHRFSECLQTICASVEGQQALAASVQAEFEKITQQTVLQLVEHVGVENLDGVVLTGGCALNVLANQKIRDQPLQYLGFRLWDEDILGGPEVGTSANICGTMADLAELLAGGPAWQREANRTSDKPIIAVVRGRQEFGPRALGHRSLVAVPDSQSMKDRMNRLKVRQWYRPVAPMIAEEALEEVFGEKVESPYMTMAPRVREEVRERFPALAHFDGTARHQSVSRSDEPWVHALLLAVGKLTGLMLDELVDLDFLVIEDWIFRKR